MNIPSRLALIVAAASLYAVSARAAVFNFDSIPTGGFANDASVGGVTFEPAVFGPVLDANGDAIPGTERWRVDTAGDPILVVDPVVAYGRPPAPSPSNALDGLLQPTLVMFSSPTDLSSFRVTLDNDEIGQPIGAGLKVEFLDVNGVLLGAAAVDQTIPGFLVAAGPIFGVKSALLPAGALYDNLAINEAGLVPEPGGTAAVVGLALAVFCLCRRKAALQ